MPLMSLVRQIAEYLEYQTRIATNRLTKSSNTLFEQPKSFENDYSVSFLLAFQFHADSNPDLDFRYQPTPSDLSECIQTRDSNKQRMFEQFEL